MGRKQLILKPGPNGKGICLCRASRIPKCIPEEVVKAILDADCLSDFLFIIKVEDFKQIELLVGNIGYALDRNNPNTAYFIASRTSDGNYEISYTNTNDDEVSIDISDLLKDSSYHAWEVDGDYYDDLTPYIEAIDYDGSELIDSHQWFKTLTADGREVFFKGVFKGLSLESITYNPNGADLSTDAEAPMFDFKLTRVDKTQPLNVGTDSGVYILKKLVGFCSGAIAVYMPSESVPESLKHFADSDKANTFPTMHTGYDGVCMVFSASVRSDKKAGSFTDAKALFTFGEPIKYVSGATAIEVYYHSTTTLDDILENCIYTLNKGDFIVNSPDSEHNGYDLNIALADGSELSGKLDATYMLVNSDGSDVVFEEKLLAVSEGTTSVKITVPENKTVSIRQNGDESVDLVFTYYVNMPETSHGWHDTIRDALIAYDESYSSYTFTEKDISSMSDDSVFNVELMNAVELKNFNDSILASVGSKLVVLDTYKNKVTVDYVESIQANTSLGGIDIVDLDTSGSTKYVLVSGPGASSSFKKISEYSANNIALIKSGVPETDEDLELKIVSCAFGRAQLDWTDEINVTTSYTGSHHATIEREAGYLLDTFASAKSLDGAGTIYAITTVKVDGVFYLSNVVKHEFTTANEVFRFSNETPIYVTTNGIGNIAVWDSKVTNLSESLEDTIQSLGGEYAAASVVNTFDCSTIKQTGDYAMGLETTKVSDDRQGITVLSNVPETALLKYDAKLITVDVVDGLYCNPSVEEINVDKTTCDLAKVSFDTSGSKVYALYSFNYMANPRTSDIERFDAVASGFALTGNSSTDKNTVSRYFGYHSYLSGNGISDMIGSIALNNYCLVSDERSANTFITGPVSVKGYNDDITDMTHNPACLQAVKFKLVGGKYYIEDDSFTIDAVAGEEQEGAGVTTSTVTADALLLIPGLNLEGKLKVWNSKVEEPLFAGENDDLLCQRAIAAFRAKYPSKTISDDVIDGSALTADEFVRIESRAADYSLLKNHPGKITTSSTNYRFAIDCKDGYISNIRMLTTKNVCDMSVCEKPGTNLCVYYSSYERFKVATDQDVSDYNYLKAGLSNQLTGTDLENAINETLAAVKRFARRTFEDHSINGVSRVQSAIVDNTSSPIMIKTPYKYKIVSTDGSSIPTDYLVMHAYDFTSMNAPANSVVPFGNIHYQYSYRTFNEICNNSDSYHTRLHIPATLPDGIAFKFWHEGEEEPMLDWELEQSTTDPGTGDTAEGDTSEPETATP